MNILIQLSHPAHFHLYKNAARNLMDNGHQVHILIKSKDILEDILVSSGLPYRNILEVAHRKSKFGILWDMLVRDWKIFCYCIKNKIDLLTGSTPEVAHIGWLLRRFSVNTGEDDAAVVPAFEKMTAPFMQTCLSPVSCYNGRYEKRTIHYEGFQKLAYLHPNQFKPDMSVVRTYGIDPESPYFIMRFAKLNAHHDKGVSGINTEIAQRLIDILSPVGRVFITSERELEPQFEQYRLQINPLDIHHVMSYATLYLGDSQSMAVEAAMLGVPSLRFNDFVGPKRIGVLVELEEKYKLTYGISSKQPEVLYDKVKEILALPNIREEWQERRQKMLADKIDVTAFFTWFIENYPESKKIMKENPDYQYNFK